MASLYKKTISGKPYWYLREMGRVDGKPKMISERYLGSGADIAALLDAREVAPAPPRPRGRQATRRCQRLSPGTARRSSSVCRPPGPSRACLLYTSDAADE